MFDFEPRKNAEPRPHQGLAADAVTELVTGRVHIDEANRRVVRLEARNVPGQKASVATRVKLVALARTQRQPWTCAASESR